MYHAHILLCMILHRTITSRVAFPGSARDGKPREKLILGK